MYPVSTYTTTLRSALTTYATIPVQNCIAHINEFVITHTRINHPLARAPGPLTALGVVALTAQLANIAWNKKCLSQTNKIASRSLALALTAFASFVTLGTVTSMTDRKLLVLPAIGIVLFTALRSTTTKTSRPQIKERAPNNSTVHQKDKRRSPNAATGNRLENGSKARTETTSEKTTDVQGPIAQATAKTSRLKEGTPDNSTTLQTDKQPSPDTVAGDSLENGSKARTEAAKTAVFQAPIDQATAAHSRLTNASEIAKRRAEQNLVKRQLQSDLEAEERSLEQSFTLEQMRASVFVNFNRLNKLFTKQDDYKKALQQQRELLLQLFSDLCSEMQRKNQEQIKLLDAPENFSIKKVTTKPNEKSGDQNAAKSRIRIELQAIEKIEENLRENQKWMQTSDRILGQSIDEAIKYHIKTGETSEKAKEYWEKNVPNPELRQQRINKNPLDQKVAKTFGRVVDLWNLRLDNEIKIASNLVQQRFLRMQKNAAIERFRAINQKTDLLQILQDLQSQKGVSNAEADQSNLSQVQDALRQSQQIVAVLEKIEKAKRVYQSLKEKGQEIDVELKFALGEFRVHPSTESSIELSVALAN